jgi:hypothetical protein
MKILSISIGRRRLNIIAPSKVNQPVFHKMTGEKYINKVYTGFDCALNGVKIRIHLLTKS